MTLLLGERFKKFTYLNTYDDTKIINRSKEEPKILDNFGIGHNSFMLFPQFSWVIALITFFIEPHQLSVANIESSLHIAKFGKMFVYLTQGLSNITYSVVDLKTIYFEKVHNQFAYVETR